MLCRKAAQNFGRCAVTSKNLAVYRCHKKRHDVSNAQNPCVSVNVTKSGTVELWHKRTGRGLKAIQNRCHAKSGPLDEKNRDEKKPCFWGFFMKWDREPSFFLDIYRCLKANADDWCWILFPKLSIFYFASYFLLLLFRALDIDHQSMLKHNSVFWISSIRKENFFLFTHQLHFLDCVLEKMKFIATITLKWWRE